MINMSDSVKCPKVNEIPINSHTDYYALSCFDSNSLNIIYYTATKGFVLYECMDFLAKKKDTDRYD